MFKWLGLILLSLGMVVDDVLDQEERANARALADKRVRDALELGAQREDRARRTLGGAAGKELAPMTAEELTKAGRCAECKALAGPMDSRDHYTHCSRWRA